MIKILLKTYIIMSLINKNAFHEACENVNICRLINLFNDNSELINELNYNNHKGIDIIVTKHSHELIVNNTEFKSFVLTMMEKTLPASILGVKFLLSYFILPTNDYSQFQKFMKIGSKLKPLNNESFQYGKNMYKHIFYFLFEYAISNKRIDEVFPIEMIYKFVKEYPQILDDIENYNDVVRILSNTAAPEFIVKFFKRFEMKDYSDKSITRMIRFMGALIENKELCEKNFKISLLLPDIYADIALYPLIVNSMIKVCASKPEFSDILYPIFKKILNETEQYKYTKTTNYHTLFLISILIYFLNNRINEKTIDTIMKFIVMILDCGNIDPYSSIIIDKYMRKSLNVLKDEEIVLNRKNETNLIEILLNCVSVNSISMIAMKKIMSHTLCKTNASFEKRNTRIRFAISYFSNNDTDYFPCTQANFILKPHSDFIYSVIYYFKIGLLKFKNNADKELKSTIIAISKLPVEVIQIITNYVVGIDKMYSLKPLPLSSLFKTNKSYCLLQ